MNKRVKQQKITSVFKINSERLNKTRSKSKKKRSKFNKIKN